MKIETDCNKNENDQTNQTVRKANETTNKQILQVPNKKKGIV